MCIFRKGGHETVPGFARRGNLQTQFYIARCMVHEADGSSLPDMIDVTDR